MWGALLRIEGSTARTEGKVDALAITVSGLTTRVDASDLVISNLRSKLDQIEGERSQMVPEFKALITRTDDLEEWQTKVETSANTTAMIVKFIFGGQLVTILAALFAFYHAMAATPAPADQQHTKTTIEQTVSAPAVSH
jgi:hypothetical protein